MSDDARQKLYAKIAQVQRNIEAVQLTRDEDDSITYAAAPAVFDVVREELRKRRLSVLPSVDRAVTTDGVAHVRLDILVVDYQTGETLAASWDGEAKDEGDKALAKAYTAALKSFYLAFFLIPTEAPPRPLPEAPTHNTPLVTNVQIEQFVEAAEAHGVSGVRLHELALERFGVEELAEVPYHEADALLAAIEALGPKEPAAA